MGILCGGNALGGKKRRIFGRPGRFVGGMLLVGAYRQHNPTWWARWAAVRCKSDSANEATILAGDVGVACRWIATIHRSLASMLPQIDGIPHAPAPITIVCSRTSPKPPRTTGNRVAALDPAKTQASSTASTPPTSSDARDRSCARSGTLDSSAC